MVEQKAAKRTHKSARAAGSTHERNVADYLRDNLSEFIDRRVKTGAKDKGDIANVRMSPLLGGGRVVVECKNTSTLSVGPFLNEAEVERVNDQAKVGVVIAKRHGIGAIGRQTVLMTVDDLICLLTGERPVHE